MSMGRKEPAVLVARKMGTAAAHVRIPFKEAARMSHITKGEQE
jgi:hypothetical protein